MRITWAVLRAVFAIAIIAAIVAQLGQSIANAVELQEVSVAFTVVNFLGFFTIQSNILGAFVLLVGAFVLFRPTGDGPDWFNLTRAGATSYLVVTFVVYNLLLRNVELPQGTTVPWSNEILHVASGLYILADWIWAPGRRAIEYRSIIKLLVYPIIWVVYTLVRGTIAIDPRTGVGWYPYPFLNPHTSANGYLSVTFYVILIAAVIGLTAFGVLWISRRTAKAATSS